MTDAPENAPSPSTSDYVVVARRYRPQTFGELIGQQHVAQALQQAIRTGRIGHAYLFTGARGVGKTSAARILAKALNCESGPTPDPCGACDACQRIAAGDDVDVLEIDGASNRGIDEIRQLRQNAGVRPSRSRLKVYIIDEVHMLTKEAFNALLKTLEEPPEHVKFIFATTEPQKIPITILSRCQRYDFAGVDAGSIGERLRQIAEAEGVAIDEEALQILSVRAAGSMRDSQSLLEQLLAVADGQITADEVNTLLGIAPAARVAELAERLADRDAASGLALLDAAVRTGADPGQVLDQLIGYYRDVMAVTVGCPPEQMLYALPAQHEAAKGLGDRLGVQTLLAAMQVLDQTAQRMRVSVHERTLADMAIVRLASLEDLDDLAQAAADLAANPNASVSSGQKGVSSPPAAVKKNAEPVTRPAPPPPTPIAPQPAEPKALASGAPKQAEPTEPPSRPAPPQAASVDPSQAPVPAPHVPAPPPTAPEAEPNSLTAQLAAMQQNGAKPAPAAPRVSRQAMKRQQLAEVTQQPFVAKAIELFGVEPDKIKYQPPRDS
ncbi:DNA polymerase III subunit tau [Planctomycetes bacterium MalM25]|nr:DNA polymerase III subunit tau [Planctomycetes bacterium MalM25]